MYFNYTVSGQNYNPQILLSSLTAQGLCYTIRIMNKILFNRITLLLLTVLLLTAAAGCGAAQSPAAPEATAAPTSEEAAVPLLDLNARIDVPDRAVWNDNVLTIAAAGDYRLTGSLEGRVTVDADGPVTLVCEGVTLTGENCLLVRSGDPVTLIGAAGTENIFTDVLPEPASGEASAGASSEEAASAEAASAEAAEDPNADGTEEEADIEETEDEADASGAVINSKAPLLFAAGSFTVNANVNNGIRAKDGVALQDASLAVTAANKGLRVRGAITVLGGELNVTAGGDALSAEAGRMVPGSVELRGGSITLTAGDDGIAADEILTADGVTLTIDSQHDGLQAVSDLTISGGTLSVTTGGGGGSAIEHPGESFGPWAQASASEESGSAKGLKSDGSITVSGGELTLNTDDDSIHCATLFTMDGGNVSICSNDDAIHSDDWLVINDGTVRIDDCFEGLEAFAVEIRGGDVVIRAVNDGINANGPEMMFRRSTEDTETEVTSLSGASVCYVLMAGGKVDLVVTGSSMNQGDGIDSNGAVYVTGGELIVSTFGTFMENGLDTGWGGPVVTGGKVIAGGSSTMAEGFSAYSTQCAAVVATSYMPDGTEVILSDAEGNVLWDVVLADAFSCLQISHPDMQVGQVYTLTYGSESTTLDFTNSNLVQITGGFGPRRF